MNLSKLNGGKLHIRRQTTQHSIRRMSRGEFSGYCFGWNISFGSRVEKIFFLPSQSLPEPPRKMKIKVINGLSFPKERECRSISTKPLQQPPVRCSLQQWTFLARRQESENSLNTKTFTYLYE